MADEVERFDVLGVPVACIDLARTTVLLERWAREAKGRFVCARDVARLMAIIDDPVLSPLHDEAALILPDGMPLAVIGKLRGKAVSRTSGPDVMAALCALPAASGLRHYFYGGGPGTAALLAERLSARNPTLAVAGLETPAFAALGPDGQREAVARMRASGANIVWVGLSSPKQDAFMRAVYRDVGCLMVGVGAAFDYHAGLKRRAPQWMQRAGLEWLYRLVTEPRRLWRRYLVLAPCFVWRVLMAEATARWRRNRPQRRAGEGAR